MALSSTDPRVLFGNAKCFACLTSVEQLRDQTYLLAYLAGFPTDKAGVESLLAASKCMACLTTPQLRAVKAYLIALGIGVSTTQAGVRALEDQAKCVDCLTPHQQFQVQTYLLALAAGFPTTVASVRTIQENAKCFSCLTKKEQLEVQVYILTLLIPNAPTTVEDLMAAAKCFVACASGEVLSSIETLLSIDLAGTALPPCVTPTAPTLLTVSPSPSDPSGSLRVHWKQNSNSGSLIIGYIIYWGTTSGVYTDNSGFRPASFDGTYDISGLSAGTTLFVVVQAISAVSGCVSANSNERSGTTSGGGACVSALITAWAARVVANGGAAPSAATQTALCQFANGLIADGLDTSMISWNAFVPDNLIASLTPQLVGGGNDPWTNHNFLLADLTVNGLIGDGATKYLDTGLVPSVVMPSDTSGGQTIYMSDLNGNANGVYIGSSQNDGCVHAMDLQKFGGAVFSDLYGCNTGRTSGAIQVFVGYISANRTALNLHEIYEASSTVPHNTYISSVGASQSRPNLNLFAWAFNVTGAPSSFANIRISFVAVHAGLTSAQSLLFFNRIQALRTALGGGFV